MIINQCVARTASISASTMESVEIITLGLMMDIVRLANEQKVKRQKMKDASFLKREHPI